MGKTETTIIGIKEETQWNKNKVDYNKLPVIDRRVIGICLDIFIHIYFIFYVYYQFIFIAKSSR